MEMNKYQELASRTANKDLTPDLEMLNYTLGVGGESGEFQELMKKAIFHKHGIQREDVVKELGDILWYLSQCARLIGVNLEYVAAQNILKLQTRYPEKFTTEDSIARVDVEEQG